MLNGANRDFNCITIDNLINGVSPISRISNLVKGGSELSLSESHVQNRRRAGNGGVSPCGLTIPPLAKKWQHHKSMRLTRVWAYTVRIPLALLEP